MPYQMEVNTKVYVERLQLVQAQIHNVALSSGLLALQTMVHWGQLILAYKERIAHTSSQLHIH